SHAMVACKVHYCGNAKSCPAPISILLKWLLTNTYLHGVITMPAVTTKIEEILGADGATLLTHECKPISKDMLRLPGPDFIDRVLVGNDPPVATLRNLGSLFN